MIKKSILAAIGCLTLSTNVWADETGGLDVGVKLGTLGAGVEINYPLSSMLSISAGLNKFSQSEDDSIDGIEYDVDLDLQTISLFVNYHPFSGSFRITAGAMINGNELSMAAKPNATYDIDGNIYTAAEVGSLEASVDFNSLAPYVGIGYGNGADKGLGFTFDVGVLMQGEPNVDLESKGGLLSNDPTFQADLDAEEKAAEDDIDDFTIYPVLAVGVSYRF